MQDELFDHILEMIPEHLRSQPQHREVIQELFQEIRSDFNKSMKKSMGMGYRLPVWEIFNTGYLRKTSLCSESRTLPTCVSEKYDQFWLKIWRMIIFADTVWTVLLCIIA